jgi:hypothetical protein
VLVPSFTTEELQLCYRLLDIAADDVKHDVVASSLFRASAELLRVALRERTVHDPWPGQLAFPSAPVEH